MCIRDSRVDVVFNDQWQILSDDFESHLIDKATTFIEVPQGYTNDCLLYTSRCV